MKRGSESLVDAARAAHRLAVAGQLGTVGAALRELEAAKDAITDAWAAALRSELWLAEPRYGWRPTTARLRELAQGPKLARAGAMVALANVARAAVLDFDGGTLAALEPLGHELSRELPDDAALAAELVSGWASLAGGEAAEARDRASEIVKRGSKARLAGAVVEAQAMRALASTALGEHDASLDLARRASLMARTEGLPQPEFLAHLALARARRHARQPHLALRILSTLATILPRPWRAWLAWETVFASGSASGAGDRAPTSNAGVAVCAVAELLEAARAGDRPRFASLVEALLEHTRSFAPAHGESLDLVGAIDPTAPGPRMELAAWRRGETVLAPASLHGLRTRETDGDENAVAYVLAAPGERGVRLLHWGKNLHPDPDIARIRQSHRVEGRVETLLAIVALAGPDGLDEATCFSQAYGFEWVPDVHRGVFDVLLHRARGTLGAVARLERRAGGVALLPERPLLVPDPRVSQRTTDRVLRLLAERGTAGAKDAAGALGISLRSAQSALAELAASGACDAQKEGRNVAYVVEDTVFSEPSRRLVASDLTGLTTVAS